MLDDLHKRISEIPVGAYLALTIVAFLPNYGIEKFGPSPVLPAIALCLMGLAISVREKGELFTDAAQRRWLILFLLLLLPVLISIPGSFSPRLSLSIGIVLGLYFFSGVALIRTFRQEAERRWLIKWISMILLFWVFDAMIQYGFGQDLFGVSIAKQGRVVGPFEGSLRLSLFLAFFLPLFLAWFMPRSPTLSMLGFCAIAFVVMLSGARSAFVYLVVIAGGVFLHMPGGRKKWLIALALSAMAGLSIALSPVLQERFARFETLRQPTFESIDKILSYRLTIWDTAMNMVIDRPASGVGAGSFQAAYQHYSTIPDDIYLRGKSRAYHAHQLYVGLAAETGVIGLVAFLVVLVLVSRWYWMASRERRKMAWPFTLALLAYVFPLNSQPVLYQQWLFPVLLLLLAGLLTALDEPGKAAEKTVSCT